MLQRFLLMSAIKRLFGRNAPPPRGRMTMGRGGGPPSRGRGGYPSRGRGGRGRVGMFGPVPYYSTRTRGGTQVSVGGCCLPLAVSMLAAPPLAVRALRGR